MNEHPDYKKGIEHGADMLAKEIDRLVIESLRMSDKGYETAPLDKAPRFDQHYDMDKIFTRALARNKVGPVCWCYTCADAYKRMTTFIVCPTCGNKRCPHATDHNLQCTNSNEPGQKGSRYE